MPHILITSRTIVLTRGNALTSKCILHGVRNQSSCPKEVTAELFGNVQHVLVVSPRCNQAIAPDSRVVMKRNERKYARLNQDDFRIWSRRRQGLCQMAERTLIVSRCVFQPLSFPLPLPLPPPCALPE